MPITVTPGATIYTGSSIDYFRLCALRGALRLEMAGMKRRGRSAYSIIKTEFGFRGTRARVLSQLESLIEVTASKQQVIDESGPGGQPIDPTSLDHHD